MTATSELTLSKMQLANDSSLSDPSVSSTPAAAMTGSATQTAAKRNTAVDAIASDSVKVSMAGTMLSQATTGSDVRFEKVAVLRQSIEDGTYNTASADVASKLLESLQK